MEHSAEEWAALQLELELLRQQNKNLKQQIHELKSQHNNEDQYLLMRSSVQPFHIKKSTSKEEANNCPYCHPSQKTKEELVSEFQSWSEKLSFSLFKKKKDNQIRLSNNENSLESSPIKQKEAQPLQQGFMEKICLFGPREEISLQMNNKKMQVPHQLYFPDSDPLFSLYESYGCSLYPEAVQVKVIREKNKSIEVDKIIFRKSLKTTDCKLVIFQSKEEFSLPKNRIRRNLNPFSTVYCVSLDFSDFLFSDKAYHGLIDRTFSLSQERGQELDIDRATNSPEKVAAPSMLKRDSSVYGQTSIFKSNFSISVMSYYPFIDFFCQFLLQLINYIKIKRIEVHSKNPQNWEYFDIKYVSRQLDEAMEVLKPLFKQKIDEGIKFDYKLGEAQLSLGLHNLKEEMSRDWAYRMLRLLDKDTLYEIFCLVMQQQSICFFSQSSYSLTFMIYLFVGLLIHPFSYPHTIVSSVFEMDHLQTPFIAVMGLNKPLKWLQSNEQDLMEKIAGKILVVLSQEDVKIKTKKKQKLPKSDRLRKIFANFYKRIEKLDNPAKRKEILTKEITKAENDLTQQLLSELQVYFNDQLLRYLPNREIIDAIRKQMLIGNPNVASVSVKLIKTIEQYIAESRKNIERDQFIDILVQKQIFSVYLTIVYDIA